MKVIYHEEIENHTAYDRNKFCAKCGAHEWSIVKETDPDNNVRWFVMCPQCGAYGPTMPTRKLAIQEWKKL